MDAGWYVCAECGVRFYREKSTGPASKYCSHSCKQAAYEKRKRVAQPKKAGRKKLPRKACEYCGKPVKNLRAKYYCSQECATKATQGPKPEPRACERCGQEFTPSKSQRSRTVCPRCAWLEWKESNPNKAAQTKARCRAKRRGDGKADKIDPIAVFERDGWICGICGKKVNRRLKYPHPRSVSLDHIIPLSRGGKHTLSNVQCAHFICNCKKHTSDGGQLRLGLQITVPGGS